MATEFNHARRELLVGATDAARYPHLDAADLAALSALAESCSFKDGEAIFHAGQCDLDLFVVESGGIDIINSQQILTESPRFCHRSR